MKKTLCLLLALLLAFSLAACTPVATPEPSKEPAAEPTAPAETAAPEQPTVALPTITTPMKPGTYTEEVWGMHEGLVVDVTLGEKVIESIVIVSNNETVGVADAALAQYPGRLVDTQNLDMDTVAGASRTCEGIHAAVVAAIEQAGGNPVEFTAETVAAGVDLFDYADLKFDVVPTSWDYTYEIIVVGGGFAGLAATHTAKELGANVVLVEKMPNVGGNSAINGGQFAAYTTILADEIYKRMGVEPDTAENHIQDTIAGDDYMGNPALIEAYVHGAPLYFNQLLEKGLVVRDTVTRPGGHYSYRVYGTENQIGSDITTFQYNLVQESGAEVMLNTKMVEIYRESDGEQRVVGIRVATEDGYKNIQTEKGVILCTGGFGVNKEMRQLHVPTLTPDYPSTNNVSATGEGIQLAQAIGANTSQMAYIQLYPFADPETGVLDDVAVLPFSLPSYGVIYVDIDGNRYVAETQRRDVNAKAAKDTGATTTFSIMNDEILWKFGTEAVVTGGMNRNRIIKGETLEELVAGINALTYQGETINMSADTLRASIIHHNGFLKTGVDEDFGAAIISDMIPIDPDAGPFYAVPQWPSVHHTMGGLTITKNTEVMDIYLNVIPGLYAAGEVTSGIHGTNRLGANATSESCTYGMIAGTYVATGKNPVEVS